MTWDGRPFGVGRVRDRRGYDTCPSGKDLYKTRARARQGAAILMRNHSGDVLSVYKCPECRYWHLTRRLQRPKAG